MDLKDVRQLLKMLADTDVAEIEIHQENGALVRVIRDRGQFTPAFRSVPSLSPGETPATGFSAPGSAVSPTGLPAQDQTPERSPTAVAVTSPMVGTFYNAASPEAPPFVKTGEMVKKGDTLCIIEAMKLMNEIESEVSGRVIRIIQENASPVEYGEELFLIEPG
ncbi:MAG: acetyl-CoA carboxylase biotin carboxyl carrier protein [Magnetococcales bacterium]|nr:acetyl-CoA carboxylase biotin carboxyl carrier protein [Magnetococcales bacterium]